MPKSNFNQFLNECEYVNAKKTSIGKISFETNSQCNDECESQTNQTNQTNQNGLKTLNVFSSNSNVRSYSSSSSSNVFLSKSANSGRDRFDRFSTTNRNATSITNATSVQTNIFKKTDDNNQCFNENPPATSRPTPNTVIEINNETFPSLTSAPVAAATSSSVPKKFKNFKDAICATAPTLAVSSPTKQKQARVLPNSAIPPPMVVKRDSEIYAKKMLAKTKNISAVYDDDDEEDGDYDNRDFNYNGNSKPIFNYGNDSD